MFNDFLLLIKTFKLSAEISTCKPRHSNNKLISIRVTGSTVEEIRDLMNCAAGITNDTDVQSAVAIAVVDITLDGHVPTT